MDIGVDPHPIGLVSLEEEKEASELSTHRGKATAGQWPSAS